MPTILIAISAGGVAGALARHGLSVAFPAPSGGFPWATWGINVGGCLLIGVLTAWLAATAAPAWVRPLLGIGFLGGFTTFSTYAVESLLLTRSGHPYLALVYVTATLIGALAAVYTGSRLTRSVLKR